MPFTSAPISVKDAAAAVKTMIAFNDGTNNAFAQAVLDSTGAVISPATSGNQATTNASLATIATNTSGIATSAAQTTGNTALSSILTACQAATPAGTNLIGKMGIDQTTPGTTNLVQIGGTVPVNAQQFSASADTAMQSAAVALGNGTVLPATGYGTGVVQITGTFSATISFEGTQDGTNYTSIAATQLGTSIIATTTTVPGIFRLAVAGLTNIRARISSYTSGSITATGRTTNAPFGTKFVSVVGGTSLIGKVTNNDGTNSVTIKAASTAAVATDTAEVVALSPNTPLPTGANVIGGVTEADGSNAALGAKADAAVTNPASTASAIALLKGILTSALNILPKGQATSANSAPVVIASDQAALPFAATANSSGGASTYCANGASGGNALLTNTAAAVKTSAGNLYGFDFVNTGNATAYVQIFDAATGSVTLGTTVAKMSKWVPAGGSWEEKFGGEGKITFGTAITMAATTTASGNTAPATGIIANVTFK